MSLKKALSIAHRAVEAGETQKVTWQAAHQNVMHSVGFRCDCLSASDTFMAAYLRFTREFPRSGVACDMIGQ